MTNQPIAILYCHNLECAAFNAPQEVPVKPATWHEPADVPDCGCRTCTGDLYDQPMDSDALVEFLTEPIGELEHDAERALAQAYVNAYVEWAAQQKPRTSSIELPF